MVFSLDGLKTDSLVVDVGSEPEFLSDSDSYSDSDTDSLQIA